MVKLSDISSLNKTDSNITIDIQNNNDQLEHNINLGEQLQNQDNNLGNNGD